MERLRQTLDGLPRERLAELVSAGCYGTVLPAIVLGLGRLDLLSDTAARISAIVVAVLQLLAIGAFVAQVAPAPPARGGHSPRRRPASALPS
jgi:hypothetical protein